MTPVFQPALDLTGDAIDSMWETPLSGQSSQENHKLRVHELIFAADVSPDNRLAISRGSQVMDCPRNAAFRENEG